VKPGCGRPTVGFLQQSNIRAALGRCFAGKGQMELNMPREGDSLEEKNGSLKQRKYQDKWIFERVFIYLRIMLPLEAIDLMMKINDDIRKALESDLGLSVQFMKGQTIPVKNCWHFSTDGNLVDYLFNDDEDFIAGINRLFILSRRYNIVILAYSLMGTHIHIIIWGQLRECEQFVIEFLRLTSMHLSRKYGDKHKLTNVHPHCQTIDNDRYLKTAICYVVKNAPVGGISFNAMEYPWSSAPLYFKRSGYWSSDSWNRNLTDSNAYGVHRLRKILKTKSIPKDCFKLIGTMVFPDEIVATDMVENLFRSHKSFNYFMCISKESDVESIRGAISRLSLPHTELHQHKIELCKERFGVKTIRSLSTLQRLSLAKALLAKYNCSPKQVAKACGLKFEEIKSFL